MGTKTPSKFLSMSYLRMLQLNDFCNKDTGKDYDPTEVVDLIWRKNQAFEEAIGKRQEIEENKACLAHQKKFKYKMCSHCLGFKNFKHFHTDKSKKHFALRSWCKTCRKGNK